MQKPFTHKFASRANALDVTESTIATSGTLKQ